MPFREVSAMDERREFVRLALDEASNVRQLCRRFGISPMTGYKWLERYRVARGAFPESLDALTPEFIAKVPHDVIGGQPLKYRREADGSYVLYSVGWDEEDDGGEAAFNQDGTVDVQHGDWVWRSAAKAE